MQCILSFRELSLDEYTWQLISVNLMVADCNTPLSMYRPKLANPVFNMSGDFGQCSESFNVFGYLPRVCRITLSCTQNFYFGWFIIKNAVGGHVGRDTGIRKSEQRPPPLTPRNKICQVRGAEGSVLGLLSSDVCKVNNTDECWWLLMRIRIQLKSRVFLAPANRTTFSQGYRASPLDFWWYSLNDTQFEIILREWLILLSLETKNILFVVYWLTKRQNNFLI